MHLITVAAWIYVIDNSLRSIWKKASLIIGKLSLKRKHSKEPSAKGTETEEPIVPNLWLLCSEHNYPWESLKGNRLNLRCTPGNKHWKHRIALLSIINLVTEASPFKQDSTQKCLNSLLQNILLQLSYALEYSCHFSVKPERPEELTILPQKYTTQEPGYASHRLQNWLYKCTPFQSGLKSTWCPVPSSLILTSYEHR